MIEVLNQNFKQKRSGSVGVNQDKDCGEDMDEYEDDDESQKSDEQKPVV